MKHGFALIVSLYFLSSVSAQEITGELKTWHRVTLTLTGPSSSEQATPNPFRNYRLEIDFTHASGKTVTVPGYFAADGQAGETGATSGNQWRAHFMPDLAGPWAYQVRFRQGPDLAVDPDPSQGTPVSGDGLTGTLIIGNTDKTGRDLRGKGMLQYRGKSFWQFAETGERWLKGGADSPENFLAYNEFDGTPNTHRYLPHAGDYSLFGGPTWRGNLGRNIFGALNYLASKGMNSVYMITMNVQGDGRDVWPWTGSHVRDRFDVSKLDQWIRVFDHMNSIGLVCHILTQETENDMLLNGGDVGLQRSLYYRELMARTGALPGALYNLGEEYDVPNSSCPNGGFPFLSPIHDELKRFHPYAEQVPIVVHNRVVYLYEIDDLYDCAQAQGVLGGTSMQLSLDRIHAKTKYWRQQSMSLGRPYAIFNDEQTPFSSGVVPDSYDFWHDEVRHKALYGNLMGGGSGCEWYFGYSFPHDDLDCEDWRTRDHMWELTRYGLDFFRDHLPYWDMRPADSLVSGPNYGLAKRGEVYALYLPQGGNPTLDLSETSGEFEVAWFDPRYGGGLQAGTVAQVTAGGVASLGNPPNSPGEDWLVLVRTLRNVAPRLDLARVSPQPIVLPQAGAVPVSFEVWAQDNNGFQNLGPRAYFYFYDPNGNLLGPGTLPAVSGGGVRQGYRLDIQVPAGVAAGTYSYRVLIFDQDGGFDFQGPFPLEVVN